MDLLLIFGIPLVAVFFASRHEDALTQAQNLLRPLPNSHPALRIAAASAAFAGRADVAHQWAKRLLQIELARYAPSRRVPAEHHRLGWD